MFTILFTLLYRCLAGHTFNKSENNYAHLNSILNLYKIYFFTLVIIVYGSQDIPKDTVFVYLNNGQILKCIINDETDKGKEKYICIRAAPLSYLSQ